MVQQIEQTLGVVVRSTEHLSTEAIAAFVDGELRMTAHLRAGHHLSLCPQCAAEVDAQGQARAALRESCPINMPSGLLGLLSQIPHRPIEDPPTGDDAGKFTLVVADTLKMQLELLRDGYSNALTGQRPFEMGEKTMDTLLAIKKGQKVPEIIYTGLDLVTKDNVAQLLK